MKVRNKRAAATAAMLVASLAGSVAAVAATTGPAAAVTGPSKCYDMVNPGNVQFFGAKNCSTVENLYFYVHWKGQFGMTFACVRPGHTLWEDSTAQEIGVTYATVGNTGIGIPTPCTNPNV